MSQDYIILIGLWAAYFSLHSILASTWVKNELIHNKGLSKKNYRLLYTIIAVISLLGLLVFMLGIKTELLFEQVNWQKYFGLLLATLGLIVVKLSFKNYPLKEFLGLVQEGASGLHTSGILSYVRHPIYSGTLLLVFGYFLFSPTVTNLVSACCFLAYIFIGIQFEEKKLINEFGDVYREYRKSVAMLIPYLL